MKNLRKVILAAGTLVVVGSLMITSCAKDGAQGPAGATGPTGKDGTNGKDANSSCLVCHTTANFDAKLAEYKFSKHFMGNTSARNGKFCAKCHTHEGFLQIQTSGQFTTAGDMPFATRINCATCHAHSGFNFSDTLAEILTNSKPVWLDFDKGQKATDYGKLNNLCASCHQVRCATALVYSDTTLTPDVINAKYDAVPYFPFNNSSDNDEVNFMLSRTFRVHDGNQSNLNAGINGYEFKGQTYTRVWKHSDFSCTDCHMNTFNPADSTGGHTLHVNKAECTTCHGDPYKMEDVQAAITIKLNELRDLLVARKLFKKTTSSSGVVSYNALETHDFNGKLFLTTQSEEKFASAVNTNSVNMTTGVVGYSQMLKYAKDTDYANRLGRPMKWGELGAGYNYFYIFQELSIGVHNPVYARQLLQNSIDWLNANP
jgi:hypothetical protein